MPLIALDNGHGLLTAGKRTPAFTDGTKSSYTGKNFMHEWEFNRRVVELLKVELERCGFKTLDVSPSEADMPIKDRWQKANAAGADYFLSVHANALSDYWNTANGIETLVKKPSAGVTPTTKEKARIAESFRIGKILNAELVGATGLRDRCAGLPNKLLERDNVGVIYHTQMPSNLIECGFMDNDKEARLLLSESYRRLCAVAVAKGLCKAFNITYKEDKPVEKPTTPAVKPKTKFSDVKGEHWAETAIKTVSDAGIMNGYPDGTFGVGKAVTREELAVVVANLLGKIK